MRIQLRHKPEAGIAIFIVLVSILVLASMAGIFAYNMRVETKLAMNSNNESAMEWAAKAGIEKARWMLSQQLVNPGLGQRYDSLKQRWAGGPGETNDMSESEGLKDNQLDDNTKFSVTITDAERKLNINGVANNEAIMTQALTTIGVDASEIPTIIASIQDWIDVDSDTHANGAESDYYQSLNPPYFAKNGPIDDLSELLLVKGITPEIYWGPNSTNHPLSMFQARPLDLHSGLLPTTPLISMGMADVFTAVSSGKININTCSANTLRVIGMDQSSAEHLISLRAGPDGVDGTEDDVPFNNPGEIVNAGLPSQVVQLFTPYLTVRSSVFEVQVDVTVGMSTRRYHALLVRNSPKNIQILGMHWE